MKYYSDNYTNPNIKESTSDEAFHIVTTGKTEENPFLDKSKRADAVKRGMDTNDPKLAETRVPYAYVAGHVAPAAPFIPNFPDQELAERNRSNPQANPLSREAQSGLSSQYLDKTMAHLTSIPEHQLTQEDRNAKDIMYRLMGNVPVAQHEMINNKHFYPETLFDTKPRTAHISGLFADPSMEKPAMPLLGVVLEHTGAQVIEPSEDLSVHSSRLVKKAIERGFPIVRNPDNPTGKQTNTISKTPRYYYGDVTGYHMSEMPEETVTAGKKIFFNTLRDNPKVRNNQPVTEKGLSDQFLPGMQGFV
jgi:hypothetical protein